MKTRYRVPLAREPRSIVISDDGSKAFIAHVVGSRLSAVDLKAPEHPVRTVDMTGHDPGLVRRNRGVVGLLKGSTKGQERMGCQSFALAKSVDPPGRIFAPQVLVIRATASRTPAATATASVPPRSPASASSTRARPRRSTRR